MPSNLAAPTFSNTFVTIRLKSLATAGLDSDRAGALPDVVICDMCFTKKDGYEVVTALSTMPRKPLLIAVTAYADDESQERGREVGFDYYLVKPADPEV